MNRLGPLQNIAMIMIISFNYKESFDKVTTTANKSMGFDPSAIYPVPETVDANIHINGNLREGVGSN